MCLQGSFPLHPPPKEISAEAPEEGLCQRHLLKRPPSGGTQARNAAMCKSMASQERLIPGQQRPPETSMHWLYKTSVVGRAMFSCEVCQLKPL